MGTRDIPDIPDGDEQQSLHIIYSSCFNDDFYKYSFMTFLLTQFEWNDFCHIHSNNETNDFANKYW